ncbi:cyclodeaminase/cyclohydrolase family protein [Seramator thermalis]|uniref:cyclodeaminase/cyclohydrolase family protein n=1 Tax=Seramator thermalis TaxID=2496270 RepID=UPI00101CF4B6|nr:cyclodeaminase/cyclohydrolase family protein [Seramator thermalis]
MNLQDLTLKQFLEKTANNEPVPGGGSISALHGAVAAALTEMLANITIGKKNYSAVEETMKLNATKASALRTEFLTDIDRDAEAYNLVFQAFRLPKDTDEQKVLRSEKIQEATKVAAMVPMEVAERAFELLDLIGETTRKGNKNAITDGCVAMMTCRTAVLGALLNVRINLASIKDERFVKELSEKCNRIEKETLRKEQELMEFVRGEVRSEK